MTCSFCGKPTTRSEQRWDFTEYARACLQVAGCGCRGFGRCGACIDALRVMPWETVFNAQIARHMELCHAKPESEPTPTEYTEW